MRYTIFMRGLGALAILFSLSRCDFELTSENEGQDLLLHEREFPADFDYSTKNEVMFNLHARTPQLDALSGVRFDVYGLDAKGVESKLFGGITDSEGRFSRAYPVSAALEKVLVRTDYQGLLHRLERSVVGTQVDIDFASIPPDEPASSSDLAKSNSYTDLHFLSTFNTHGKPFDLVTPQEPIRQDFLNDVNASLPEGADVTVIAPQYLAEGTQSNTLLDQAADIWVTYFHEGTERKNVLGFYTYEAGNPPASVEDIDSVSIIFPNASYPGGGGNLQPGDKMHIGYFPAGTEIGWVLFSDGWNRGVGLGEWQFFSNPELNPEQNTNLRQHNVILYDRGRDLSVLGFEDVNRDTDSDNDFNDVLFYITSNPRTAISTENVASISYTGEDSDGDGVVDAIDDYPQDSTKAYNNYYPAEFIFGSLAFEDLWPNRGDYDFNDMVIDYHFTEVMNGRNEVVSLEVDLYLKAVGASYDNGFGFEIGISPDLIEAATGHSLSGNRVQLAANGTEMGQANSVIIAFDRTSNLIPPPSGYYVNTQTEAPLLAADTLHLTLNLTNPLPQATLGLPPYNPFIFVNQDREREVHLPGYAPTSLAEGSALFDTGDDRSSSAGYYKTYNNLPWALDIVETLDYPIERVSIDSAHTYFVSWAQTQGQSYPDWYKDRPGYRNPVKIYAK